MHVSNDSRIWYRDWMAWELRGGRGENESDASEARNFLLRTSFFSLGTLKSFS